MKSGALAFLGLGMSSFPSFLTRAIAGSFHPAQKKKVLICIFQRGAMDGLMAVCPFNDSELLSARPSLFMSPVKNGNSNPLIDLDGKFGLHPSFSAFEKLFKEKELAILHGVGSPNKSRSHFDAQDFMETGTPFDKSNLSGWLNRASGLIPVKGSAFRAVSSTSTLPRSLYGAEPALAISNLNDFNVRERKITNGNATASKSFEELYDHTTAGLLQEKGKETFDAIKMLDGLTKEPYKPSNGAIYPVSPLGNALMQLARLIKLEVGLEIGFAESTGWDTHYNQGTASGIFAKNAADLSHAIAAFWQDMGAVYQDQVTVMTMTEFGRTVHQNGSGGTDHGRASCSFILGKNVSGGQIYGQVPVLSLANLEDQRDLPVTTDYRALFTEVAETQLGNLKEEVLFPGWKGEKTKLMRRS